jgi:NAD-dependent dihydropyrimidine dehydrogenase PreA subunit
MCEFCTKHGDGKKWYLQAKNYAEELSADLQRQRYFAEFFGGFTERMPTRLRQAEQLARAPGFVRSLIAPLVTRHQKKYHFGQVVPLEDVQEILSFVGSVVRVPCVCRRVTRNRDCAYCLGLSLAPDKFSFAELVDRSYWNGPDGTGMEQMEPMAAAEFVASWEKDGLCHTVWTYGTPFIGGICNCDRSDCLALKVSVTCKTPVVFRAEYAARIDWEKCHGCRSCMRVCQFGAMAFSAAAKRATIDSLQCYGCGVCRSVCPNDAIALQDRRAVSEAANLWL